MTIAATSPFYHVLAETPATEIFGRVSDGKARDAASSPLSWSAVRTS